jgi:hypothetical protein
MVNKNWLLLALIAMLSLGLGLMIVACSSGDDDDDDSGDDDFVDDDNAGDDDDNDDNDDDTGADDDDDDDDDYTCAQVADGMINTCQITLLDINGTQQDQAGLEDWCALSESLFTAKTAAPFWNCMGDCVFVSFCDQACFDACLAPADPGSGCGSTVHGIYACGVVFIFNENQNLWIPEMDMAAACDSMTDTPWDCYADCTSTLTCSNPPTPDEAQAMIDCLNACVK